MMLHYQDLGRSIYIQGLIKAETTQTFFTGQNIKFLARATNDVQTYNLSQDGFYRFEVEMEETF